MGIHDHNMDRDLIYRVCAQRGWGVEHRDSLLQRAIDRINAFDSLARSEIDGVFRYEPIDEKWCQRMFDDMDEGGTLF